jgi:hypothetical protein
MQPRVARWFVFRPKIPILGKIWRALELRMLLYLPFGIIYGLLVVFVVIWLIFFVLVCLDQEKAGNTYLSQVITMITHN